VLVERERLMMAYISSLERVFVSHTRCSMYLGVVRRRDGRELGARVKDEENSENLDIPTSSC
jgi:hypothetical protein